MQECYLKPIVLRGYGEVGVNPFPCPIEVYMACWEWGKYLGPEALEAGVDVCVSSWTRMAPQHNSGDVEGRGKLYEFAAHSHGSNGEWLVGRNRARYQRMRQRRFRRKYFSGDGWRGNYAADFRQHSAWHHAQDDGDAVR